MCFFFHSPAQDFIWSAKMNGLSVGELCSLFCCPPCPSRIAAKLAFLPPEPTYALLPDLESGHTVTSNLGASGLRSRLGGGSGGGERSGGEGRWKLHLSERAEFQYSQRELDGTEVFLTRSSRGNKVGCMYIRCAPSARWVLRQYKAPKAIHLRGINSLIV